MIKLQLKADKKVILFRIRHLKDNENIVPALQQTKLISCWAITKCGSLRIDKVHLDLGSGAGP